MLQSDRGVVSPKAGESNLLGQDQVYRVLQLFLARAAGFSQQVVPLLPNELAVLGVGQPRLAAAEEHDARGAQDDEAGEQGQHAKAEQLTVGDEDARGVDRLLQGDLEQISLRGSEQLVEGVSREGVMLRSEREHPVVRGPASDRSGPGPGSFLQGTSRPGKAFLANAPERSVGLTHARAPVGAGPAAAGRQRGRVVASETGEAAGTVAREGQAVVRTVAAVEAGVGLAAVHTHLAEVSGKSRVA